MLGYIRCLIYWISLSIAFIIFAFNLIIIDKLILKTIFRSKNNSWYKNSRYYLFKIYRYFFNIFGGKVSIIGEENLPKDNQRYLFVSNHHTYYDSVLICGILKHQVFIIKEEIKKYPIIGTVLKRTQDIYIQRSESVASIKQLITDSKEMVEKGFDIMIYPEGTRIKYGQKGEIKSGFYALYKNLKLPIVILKHNTGQHHHNDKCKINYGGVKIEIFPAIEPGLSKQEVTKKIEDIFYN